MRCVDMRSASGRRSCASAGETRLATSVSGDLQYDFYSIRNRSLLFDVSIMVRTIGVLMTRKGDY